MNSDPRASSTPVDPHPARRRIWRGLALTLLWLALFCPFYVYWQMSERPGGASLWDYRIWREGAAQALLMALVGWALSLTLAALLRRRR